MDNILIVAPFKHLAKLAQRVLAEMHIDIPIVIGNDLGGFDNLALNYPNTKIFISRGGTSTVINSVYIGMILSVSRYVNAREEQRKKEEAERQQQMQEAAVAALQAAAMNLAEQSKAGQEEGK